MQVPGAHVAGIGAASQNLGPWSMVADTAVYYPPVPKLLVFAGVQITPVLLLSISPYKVQPCYCYK